jgi:SAM-dependent methyltransferase
VAEQRPSLEDVLGAKHHWYHVIELAPGVTTPGWLDLRAHAVAPQLPASMAGMRALDIGTFDGFWAFEMERRGASVIGIDIDQIPPPDTPQSRWAEVQQQLDGSVPGTGFGLLKAWFGASAERRSVNVYDLAADAVDGPVDLVFLGAILLHLRDPVRALERAYEVLKPGGQVVLFEPVDAELSRHDDPVARLRIGATIWTWWYANRACLTEWVRTAGFSDLQDLGLREVRDSTGNAQQVLTLHARRA